MPKLKTFTAACRGGHTREIKYHPLIVIVGSQVHCLALHLDAPRGWVVSDPSSGLKVCEVPGSYKGVPCNSKNAPLKEARVLAQGAVDNLIERVGSEKFNAALAAAKALKEIA